MSRNDCALFELFAAQEELLFMEKKSANLVPFASLTLVLTEFTQIEVETWKVGGKVKKEKKLLKKGKVCPRIRHLVSGFSVSGCAGGNARVGLCRQNRSLVLSWHGRGYL